MFSAIMRSKFPLNINELKLHIHIVGSCSINPQPILDSSYEQLPTYIAQTRSDGAKKGRLLEMGQLRESMPLSFSPISAT
jgi:hypothetical protein